MFFCDQLVNLNNPKFLGLQQYQIYNKPYMMSIDLLKLLLINQNYTPSPLLQLTQIRDNILNQLSQQVLVNRILLKNSYAPLDNAEFSCPSPPTKIEEPIFIPQAEEVIKHVHSTRKRRIWKNKISHNSSLRNDTKNIPKNYGKAILTFIQKSPKSRRLTAQMGIPISDFMMQVRRTKKKVNSIQGLRKMWGSDNLNHKVRKCIRILSYDFMRKHCLRYIFHSKVRNYGTHIKYRQKLIEGIQDPTCFTHIKDY